MHESKACLRTRARVKVNAENAENAGNAGNAGNAREL
jgi:hypothetical protein